MTVEEVLKRVQVVKTLADNGDDGAAHSREDALHTEVLQHIALGGETPAALAAAALKTHEINFARWTE